MRELLGKKKNIILVCTAVIAAVLSIVLPEILISYKTKSLENTSLDVPEEYYPTSSYYEVTKEFSEKLSEYQKRQLISGAWDSEISEVDKEYYEDMGYHVQENAKQQINDFYNQNFFPGSIESSYQQWYNWKCDYMQALDLNFRTYAGFFWKTSFTHYEDNETMTIYQMPDYRIIKMIYSSDKIKSHGKYTLRTNYSVDEGMRIAQMMIGQDFGVTSVKVGGEEGFAYVTEYMKMGRLTANLGSDKSNETDMDTSEVDGSLTVMVVTIQDLREETSNEEETYYLCIYQTDKEYSLELLPTE